ncbi:hypothetical protein diail_10414 [Diaporthe ilicicola]|nr:hypothetical protein diail_10414 [Diaporthe ilicicola]
MAKRGGGGGENSKKAAGQARKAESAANKKAAEDSKKAAEEDTEWSKGSKKANAKREEEAAKKAEAARKKAERDALLAEEEKNTPGRSAPKHAKSAQKKTKDSGLDFSRLDFGDDDAPLRTLNASGIDDATAALEIATTDNKLKIDRHPEKRVPKAWEAYWERREKELRAEGLMAIKGNTWAKLKRKEREAFDFSPENPKNQVHGTYNMTQEELAEIRAQEKSKAENRLAEK